jgi:hypothetical protein
VKVLSIRVKREFLNKDECLREAKAILAEGKISGMSEKQLAREIYSHALAFFVCDKILPLRWLKRYADPIDMQDGGDRPLRRAAFAVSWIMTKGNKKK